MSVFHLKHRPAKVAELDLPEVSKALTLILSKKGGQQSFLFAGPRGLGKTSAARILARAVNCLKPVGIEPCGKCANCKEILAGSSIDVIEIDGASNRGIDDVRVIKERSYLLPSKLVIKVFVIDEVHMLTKEAFNALLKLLEEPPAHTLFILCTTDPQKIPATVLSRLMRVDFRRGNQVDLLRCLDRVIKKEKIKIPVEARKLIVKKSDGSFRDIHKTFNQIFLEFGKKISLVNVKAYFAGKVGVYDGVDLETDLVKGEAKKILKKLEALASKGIDFPALRCDYVVYFQKRLLSHFGIAHPQSLGSSYGGQGVKEVGLGVEGLKKILLLLMEAGRQEKDVEIEQLPLELVVVNFLGSVKQNLTDNKILSDNKDIFGGAKKVTVEEKVTAVAVKDEVKEKVEIESKEKREGVMGEKSGVTLKIVEEKWSDILAAVKPFNHSVEAFMRSARPKAVEEGVVILEVFYPFHKQKLEEDKNRKTVEQGLGKVFDCQLLVDYVLSQTKKKAVVIGNKPLRAEVGSGDGEEKDMYDVAKEIFG